MLLSLLQSALPALAAATVVAVIPAHWRLPACSACHTAAGRSNAGRGSPAPAHLLCCGVKAGHQQVLAVIAHTEALQALCYLQQPHGLGVSDPHSMVAPTALDRAGSRAATCRSAGQVHSKVPITYECYHLAGDHRDDD